MKYLLDTNVCIKYLNADSENIKLKLKSNSPQNIFLCSVVKTELLTGAYKSNISHKTLLKLESFFNKFDSLFFDDISADICAKIRSDLEKKGKIIGPYDLQIAATALANDLTLVTHNIKEFKRIKGLKIEDWEQ